jgi:two-component system, cell cycle sensor histidine kinase and response regulator CckA
MNPRRSHDPIVSDLSVHFRSDRRLRRVSFRLPTERAGPAGAPGFAALRRPARARLPGLGSALIVDGVLVPMELARLPYGSLQNIESAESAGDAYDTRTSLTVNGLGSIVAAMFGSAFPTTIYIGHPGWKALGARAGYSVLKRQDPTLRAGPHGVRNRYLAASLSAVRAKCAATARTAPHAVCRTTPTASEWTSTSVLRAHSPSPAILRLRAEQVAPASSCGQDPMRLRRPGVPRTPMPRALDSPCIAPPEAQDQGLAHAPAVSVGRTAMWRRGCTRGVSRRGRIVSEATVRDRDLDVDAGSVNGPLASAHPARLDERFAAASRFMGCVVLSIGAAVLLGWVLDVPFLKSLHPTLVTMKPNAALGFVLLGIALILGRAKDASQRVALYVLGALVGLIGATTLAEYGLGLDLRIDSLLFRESSGAVLTQYPGRMSFIAGLNFLLLGLAVPPALACRRTIRFTSWLAAVAFGLALVALAGYGYSVTAFYDLGYRTPLALHGAAAFLTASAAVLLARTDAGFAALMIARGPGGILARRWLPLALLLPFAVEVIVRVGVRCKIFGPSNGDAIHAVALAFALVGVLFFMAERLERADEVRLRALAALRASEARYRSLFENMSLQLDVIRRLGNDILLLVGTDGSIVQVNDRAIQTYGYSEQELLHLNVRDLRAPEALATLQEQIQEALTENGCRFECIHRRRDGSTFPVEVSARTLEIGGRLFLQGIVRDLTQERAARAAIDHQAMLLDNLYDAVVGTDASFVINAWNRAAERVFGWPREDAIGRTLHEILQFVNSDGSSSETMTARATQEGAIDIESRCRTRGGAEIEIETTLVALRSATGAIQGFVLVGRDITSRKQAELARRKAQEQLLHSQKMEAIGRLASGIAHDFNNLLVVILSNAGFLAEALAEGDERREDAEGIREAGERAARLVRQLLAFSRRDEARPVATAVGTVIRGLENLLRRTLGEDVTMSISLPPEPWFTRIDPGHLEQVVMNLALNARDAMPNGGHLRIEARNETVDKAPPGCGDLAPGKYAVLAVGDTGCGMTPEIICKIFEPFFTTKAFGKGTGLGLSTVFGIVEQAKGSIAVASEPGRGSRFTIYLPVCDAPEDRDRVQAQGEAHRGRNETVLLVEDEEPVRRAARRILERNHFRVIEASNGVEGLRMLEAHHRVDVILSDIVMPELSGKELVRAVAETRPEIPVVLMSGYAHHQDVSPLSGVVLLKPFTETTLLGRIREALESVPRIGGSHPLASTPTSPTARASS